MSHVVYDDMVANENRMYENNDPNDMPLEMEWVLDEMVDSGEESMVVCSNLRRAISTAIISLWDRFHLNQKEKLHILPCLQEVGMNVDTRTPNVEAQTPELSSFEIDSKKLNDKKLGDFYKNRYYYLLCFFFCFFFNFFLIFIFNFFFLGARGYN